MLSKEWSGEVQRVALQLLLFWLLAGGCGGQLQWLRAESMLLWLLATVLVVFGTKLVQRAPAPKKQQAKQSVSFAPNTINWDLPTPSFTSRDVSEGYRQTLKDKELVCFTTPTTAAQKNSLLCLFPSTRMFDLENWSNKTSQELNMIRTCINNRSSGGAPVVVFNVDTSEKQQFLIDACPAAQFIRLNVNSTVQ